MTIQNICNSEHNFIIRKTTNVIKLFIYQTLQCTDTPRHVWAQKKNRDTLTVSAIYTDAFRKGLRQHSI